MADYTTAQDLDAYPDGKWVVDPGDGTPWIVSSSTTDGVFAIYVVPTNGPDADGDGVLDVTDNCPGVANANQADFDNDGEGDVCDGDRDGDGAPNDFDYAPDDPNVQNPPDTTAPRVDAVSPADGKTGVARGTNLRATFSEQMDPASISKSTYRLFRCPSTTSTNCTTQVTNATVAPSEDGLSATLDPYGASPTKLGAKTKYKAVVTTGAKDVAGNALDQNSSTAGNQQKAWYFTTGRM